ncbi:TRAP transporter large permease [Sedimentibacter hydroxybenzoicus DSM 7310]|uniref:TRAP transporter large permease n=1 Tax=Sedimentibacter hydroxybenzoicus DSM 7310 TaxID=1123245 RepID=A0A974GWN4_SEDHY|nr:TRAP transporter large permease [Sedimentibacter hydroxybenzoicus]NYB74679.1 TRAP transporter large permease [Sedimentibacter hydroxybenzoicus DSM 7310]
MLAILLLIGFFAFLCIGVPIGVSIGLSIIGVLLINPFTSYSYLGQTMVTSLMNFPLLAVPFFMLTGSIMETGGLSRRLVAVANTIVGGGTGGLAKVTVITCLFFGAISGSAPATVAAIGGIMIPMMVKERYSIDYAAGVSAVSGGLGVIIPPSIPFVLYGVSTGTSIGELFVGGVIPGCIIGGLLMIVSHITSKKRGYFGTGEKFSFKKFFNALWDAKWAMLVPVIILGGIYGGAFTPTEAAVVSVVYGLFVGIFVYKELKWKDLSKVFVDNGILVGAVIITAATATALGTAFSFMQVPTQIANAIAMVSTNKYVVMSIVAVFLLFVGMIMDVAAAILILAPILVQVLIPLGWNPIHFGIIMTIDLAIGFVTPPVAMNLFVASGISGVPVNRIAVNALPFIITFIFGLIVIIMFPQLTLWLPEFLKTFSG